MLHKARTTKSIWNEQSPFQGISEKSKSTDVCHFSFKVMQFPDEKRFQSHGKEKSEFRESMLLYNLVYCVDCQVPVYWVCLPESTPVQQIQVEGATYFVFRCDVCSHNFEGEKEACCRECNQEGGYLKKINVNGDQPQFIHPICAVSFPNIYQFSCPKMMEIQLCQNIELKDIDKVTDDCCDICH